MSTHGTIIDLPVPASVTTGTAVTVKHLCPEKSIQFVGVSGSTLQVMGSNNGVDFSKLGADVTGDGIVSVTTPVQWMRIDRTVGTGGTLTAVLCGYAPGYGA
jgi:hypothetical protein